MDLQTKFNQNVHKACCRLICELQLEQHMDFHYTVPYINYIMSWSWHMPINTIIVGQNPYPQKIHCEFGSAFSYDSTKTGVPKSVKVLAEDIYNYNETDRKLSIACFKDSWRLIEAGVIFINETVLTKLLNNKKNTGSIREAESQIRALQIVLTESFLMGQTEFTWIGMGIPASCMTNVMRSWYPKDLFKMRIMTCTNPAAHGIGDTGSQAITLGKTAVSKVLSAIVLAYSRMSQQKVSQADKRRQQNVNTLVKNAENVETTGNIYSMELASLRDRLINSKDKPTSDASIDDIVGSMGRLRDAVDSHRNSISNFTINVKMVIDSLPQSQDSSKTIVSGPMSIPVMSVTPRKGPRRVIRRVDAVPETPELQQETVVTETEPTPSIAPSIAPSRARRRVVRNSGYAVSNAASEYTTDMHTGNDTSTDMTVPESIQMKSFAVWCTSNTEDPVMSEILNTAAEEKNTHNDLSKDVLKYIRSRKTENGAYDAYEELLSAESNSTTWIKTYMASRT